LRDLGGVLLPDPVADGGSSSPWPFLDEDGGQLAEKLRGLLRRGTAGDARIEMDFGRVRRFSAAGAMRLPSTRAISASRSFPRSGLAR